MNLLKELQESLLLNKERFAFCIKETLYTYEQLYEKILRVHSYLKNWKNEHILNVGLVTNNDLDTYAAMLACWFSGIAYVPLNPTIPKERNSSIVKETQIRIIFSSAEPQTQMLDGTGQIDIVSPSSLPKSFSSDLKISEASEFRTSYILFTSGSTGTPKGVPISNKNLSSFVSNFLSTGFDVDKEDRCLQMFELTFDVSISSFLIPLLKGACVYTVPEGIKYVEVLKLIHTHKLTAIQMVPSIIRLGRSLIKRMNFPWMKKCILTGEATSIDLISDWQKCAPNAILYNFYGPTEATIFCSYYELPRSGFKSYNGLLTIGKAMGNTKLLIVDDQNNEAAVDQKGELLISSFQLTTGYLNNASKNEQSFIKINPHDSATYYRSGDLCYKDCDGDIMYCGRLDNQIKIQGFRVELGEIEFLVEEKFKFNNVVVAFENNLSLIKLVLVLEAPQIVDSDKKTQITEYLKTKLPDYMMPSKITCRPEFPLNSNGKTDRKKIKELLSSENN